LASAKKSRSSRGSRGQVKRDARHGRSSHASRDARRRERKTYAVHGRRGRAWPLAGTSRTRYGLRQCRFGSRGPRPASCERVTPDTKSSDQGGYSGRPASGLYDDVTIDAMKQFQAKNACHKPAYLRRPCLRSWSSKRSNDGYAVPVNSVSETEKKRSSN